MAFDCFLQEQKADWQDHPEWLIFKNTHGHAIAQELWDIVQSNFENIKSTSSKKMELP